MVKEAVKLARTTLNTGKRIYKPLATNNAPKKSNFRPSTKKGALK